MGRKLAVILTIEGEDVGILVRSSGVGALNLELGAGGDGAVIVPSAFQLPTSCWFVRALPQFVAFLE